MKKRLKISSKESKMQMLRIKLRRETTRNLSIKVEEKLSKQLQI